MLGPSAPDAPGGVMSKSVRIASCRGIVALLLCLPAVPALAATLAPVSRTAASLPNAAGNAGSDASVRAISADGCLRVFSSGATNLVPGQDDLNGVQDVFLHDCSDASLTLLSHRFDSQTATADGDSVQPTISPDGRYVAFSSHAGNLVAGIIREHSNADLYLYDRQDDSLRLVNISASNSGRSTELGATGPVFSGDSNWLLFSSASTDVLPNVSDENNGGDLFLHNLGTRATTLITRQPGGFCLFPTCTANEGSGPAEISDDGAFVAFASGATNLVAAQSDVPGTNDVFVWSRASGTTVLVSHTTAGATTAAGNRSENPTISGNGAYVAFSSHATTLIAGQVDTNADSDVFLFDRALGSNTLASHLPALPTSTDPDGYSGNPVLNGDGSLLAYTSVSQVMVAGQSDASPLSDDVFLFARATGSNTLVSHTAASSTTTGAGSTVFARFSGDDEYLVLASRANNLVAAQVDGNDFGDALMGEDIFRYAIDTGVIELLSHAAGQPARAGRFMSFLPSIDEDGDRVVFVSEGDDLGLPPDGNDERDVYLWSGGDPALLSRRDAAADPVGMIGASEVAVSADGRWVAFVSEARNVYPGLVDDDSQNASRGRDDDIFLLDRDNGTYVLVSRSNAGQDITSNNDSRRPRVSGDGRYVVFESAATDMVAGQSDSNGNYDIFLFDRTDRSVRLVSHAAGLPAQTGNGLANTGEIARDGSRLVFSSSAGNLIAGGSDTNGSSDVFLYDIGSGSLTLVSRSSAAATTAGNGDARAATLSSDGRFVAYHSSATNHVGGVDTNGETDVFVFDRLAGGNPNRLVSRGAASATTFGNGGSRLPQISGDGTYVAYLSSATNLLPGFLNDGNSGEDVYLFDLAAAFAPNLLVSHVPGEDSATPDEGSNQVSISDDGARVAFFSQATNLVSDQNDSMWTDDLFVFERDDASVRLVSQSVTVPNLAVGAERGVISGDGSVILLDSRSWELAEGLQSAATESKTYLHLVDARTSVLISRSVLGPAQPPVSYSILGAVTPDGAVSLFLSPSPDIVTFDGNRAFPGQAGIDAFVFERALGIPLVTGPPDQLLIEDQSTGALAFTVADPDGDPAQLIVTARSSNLALVVDGSIVLGGSGANRSVTVVPVAEQSGMSTITLRATDADGNVGIAQFLVEYTPLNDPPSFNLPGATSVLEGQNTGLLDFTVDDPDHDENDLLLTVASSDPAIVPTSGIALAGSGANRRIRVTPAPDRFGVVEITVAGEDLDGATGSSTFQLTITNVNDAPSFTAGANASSNEDVAATVPGWASAISAGPFEALQGLTFEITGNTNPGLFQAGPAVAPNGTLSYTPAPDASGSADITVRLRDDGGVLNGGNDASATQTFSIQVAAVNDAPTFTGAALMTLAEDGTAQYSFTVGDVEAGAAAVQVAVGSSDLSLLPLAGLVPGGSGAARTLQVTPAPDVHGNGFVLFTLTDGQGGSTPFVLEVVVTPVDEQVDLVTTFSNGVGKVGIDSVVVWTGTVTNVGADTAYAVDVFDNAPAGLSAVSWTCSGDNGALCGATSGTGAVAVEVELPPSGSAELSVTATVTAQAAPVLAYALQAAAGPETVEATPGNNVATDIDLVGEPVFADGFEG